MNARYRATRAARAGRPRFPWSALAAALLVPVLLAGGLLWGTWDSDGRLRQVRAAIVNLDEMVEVNGQMMPMGRQLAAELVDSDREQNFAWQLATAEKAADGLASGEYAAVVTIPREFSAAATSFAKPADEATQATIRVQTSPVAGLSETAIGQSVAYASTQALNGFLTREYLKNIYVGFNEMSTSMLELVDGTRQLADGTQQLADGAKQSADGARELSEGLGQAAAGGAQLSDGAQQAAGGAGELAGGAGALADGADAYAAGARTFADGVGTFAEGVNGYATGVVQFTDGVSGYTAGVAQFADGVTGYTDGVAQYAGGINSALAPARQGIEALPEWGPWLGRVDAWVTQAPGQAEQASAQVKAVVAQVRAYVTQAGGAVDGAGGLAAAAAEARARTEMLAAEGLACPEDLSEEACAGYQAGARAAGAALVDRASGLAGGAGTLAQESGALATAAEQLLAALDELDRLADALPSWAGQLRISYDELVGSVPPGTPTSREEILAVLDQLIAAGDQLTGGGAQLAEGGAALADGGRDLAEGGTGLAAGGLQLAGGASSLGSGAGQLADGATGIAGGMGQLAGGARQLADGSRQLADGVDAFASGVGTAADGSAQLADGLEQLADGTHELADGAGQLADGVAEGQEAIPTYTDDERDKLATVVAAPVDGDGLAGVVRPHLAWVSLLLVVALWAGAMATFAVLRPVAPDALTSRASDLRLLVRTLMPAFVIAFVQAVLLGGIGAWALGWSVPSGFGLIGVLAASAVTFALVSQALAALLGHTGRLIGLGLALLAIIAAATSAAPDAVAIIAGFSPLTPALSAVRGLAVGGGVAIPLVTLAGWALLGLAGALWATHRARAMTIEKVVAAAS
ncbi:MAG: YhgE/Pip family protein [Propioniciclava sp.]|uniref:YhgE/Pip family protein n=1 Tax=Propioniciclava sp. TaxID=2038686 RepID=UPI0039E6B03C